MWRPSVLCISGPSVGCGHWSLPRAPYHLTPAKSFSASSVFSLVSLIVDIPNPSDLLSSTFNVDHNYVAQRVLAQVGTSLGRKATPLGHHRPDSLQFSNLVHRMTDSDYFSLLSGCCSHVTSAFCSAPVSCAAMVHPYNLAKLCWIALNIGGYWSSTFNLIFKAGRCNHDHCLRRRCCALAHCNVLFPRFLHTCISHLLFTPASVSSSQCLGPLAEHNPVRPCGCSPSPRGPSCWFSSPILPCCCGDFRLLCAPTAECDVVSSAVAAFLLCVAAESALLCSAPHDVALIVTGMLWPWAVATGELFASLALYVATSAAALAPAVWTCIHERFNSVSHSCPPWYLPWPVFASHCSSLLPRPLTMRRSPPAAFSPWCCGGTPTTVCGPGP